MSTRPAPDTRTAGTADGPAARHPRRGTRPRRRGPVVVVGAGPYGLSVASRLGEVGVRARVLGEPMATWRHHMPAGMFLKSTPAASNLSSASPEHTLTAFCRATGRDPLPPEGPVPIETFVAYGSWFQQRVVPHLEAAEVAEVRRGAGNRLAVRLRSGDEIGATAVVMANGLVDHAHVPAALFAVAPGGPSVAGPVSHSSQHADLSGFAGRRVAVVGAGQSAIETAVLLREHGARVHLVARHPLRWADPPRGAVGPPRGAVDPAGTPRRRLKPGSPLGPGWSLAAVSRGPGLVHRLPAPARLALVRGVLGPSGAWWIRHRFTEDIEVHAGLEVRSAEVGPTGVGLTLAGPGAGSGGAPRQVVVDHVIAATGYRVDLSANRLLAPELLAGVSRTGGSPRLSAAFESSERGLFFAGLASAASFGPVLRFVHGADFNSRRISRALASRIL